MVAGAESDSVANTVLAPVIDGGSATTGSSVMQPQVQPPLQTGGPALIDTTNPFTTVKPQLFTGSSPNPSTTPGEHATAAQATPVDRAGTKLDEKPRVANKKPASTVQVYELPDGRQVTVRRPIKTDAAEPWSGGAFALLAPGCSGRRSDDRIASAGA